METSANGWSLRTTNGRWVRPSARAVPSLAEDLAQLRKHEIQAQDLIRANDIPPQTEDGHRLTFQPVSSRLRTPLSLKLRNTSLPPESQDTLSRLLLRRSAPRVEQMVSPPFLMCSCSTSLQEAARSPVEKVELHASPLQHRIPLENAPRCRPGPLQ